MLKFAVVLVLCLAGVALSDQGVNWALLVAGSNEYYNYRHQADICHAYQILHRNGIPDERIVVMMYDDIANNEENPFKGTIINHPDGKDVYAGTLKDYTKSKVNPQNFLKALQGQSSAGSKVINSGPDDNVFVFFSDHGAPGIVAFPDGSALHASELNKAIQNMYNNKKFKNMVLYIEACESGSMFEGLLPANINVYATTAANAEESSYACYYDDKRETYLGDLYSVNWMEDSDKENINTESLAQQFKIVQALTNESHVMQYGNLSMASIFNVGQFQAETNSSAKRGDNLNKPKHHAVKTEDARITILNKRLEKETDDLKRVKLVAEIQKVKKEKKVAVGVMTEIVSFVYKHDSKEVQRVISAKKKLSNHECYVPVVDRIIAKCFTLKNEFVLRNLYMMVNLCHEEGMSSDKIINAIDNVCKTRFD